MKKSTLLFLFYLTCQQLLAQKFDITISKTEEEIRRSENYALPNGGYIGMQYVKDNGSAANWVKRRETISLLLFSADMKPVKENKMANGERAFSVVYTAFKKIGDKFWLIYTEPGDKSNFGDFKVVEINPITLEATTPKTIVAPGEIYLKPGLYGMLDLKIEFKTSPNGKFAYYFISSSKNNAYLLSVNEEFDIAWSKNNIATDIGIDPNNINSFTVNNQGDVFLGYLKDDVGHVAVYRDTKAAQILDITIKKGKPKEVLVLARKNNAIVTVAGGYFDNISKNAHGVFTGNIDVSFKSADISAIPFPDSIVKQFDQDSWGSTKPHKFGIEPQYLAELFEIDDNTVDLVIEIKKKVSHDNIGTVVHSGNILNVYFGNGATSFTRIPKYNVAVGSDWSHYYAMPFEKKMIIFYNDNPSNLKRDINGSVKLVNIEDNSVLVAAVIEPDGRMERRLPLDLTQNYMGIAEWMLQVAEGRLQMPVYFKKKGCYATIQIK